MTIRSRLGLGTSLIMTLSVTATAGTLAAERAGLIELAQAQTDDDKNKKKGEAPPKKGPPPPPKQPPGPPPKATPAPPPPPKAQPPQPQPKAPPPAPKASPPPAPPPPPKGPPPVEKKQGGPPPAKAPESGKGAFPSKGDTFQKGEGSQRGEDLRKGEGPRGPDGRRDRRIPQGVSPADRGGGPSQGSAPPGGPGQTPAANAPPPERSKDQGAQPGGPSVGGAQQGFPKGTTGQPGGSPGGPDATRRALQQPGGPDGRPAVPGPQRFEEVQKGREERVEEGGRRRVIHEPGNRVIIKQDNRVFIHHDEGERFRRRPDAKTERRPDGVQVTFFDRPGGVRVVTEVDGSGRLLRRYRRGPEGREVNLIDNRRFYRNLGVGVAVGLGAAVALSIARPRITIPRERYIVEYDRARDEDLDEVLLAPPIERLDRAYSLEEIRYNHELREYTRRIDLDINFEFGAWQVGRDQYGKLERLARAMLRALRRNPDLIFLVEGHTDAVGSDVDNSSLSDRRAASVAEILTDEFGVPPENLVTQGYGEQYLKIDTQGPEARNRRVAIRNVTGLMSER